RKSVAIDLQYPGAALADAAIVAEHHGRCTETVVFEVELELVLAGAQLWSLPTNALEVDEIPGEHGLVLQHVKAVSAEPPALRDRHAFGPALRNLDVRLEIVGGIEQARRIAVRRAGERPAPGEGSPAGGGEEAFSKWMLYLFDPSSGLPDSSARLSG